MAAPITRLTGYRHNDSPARWQRALARAVAEGVTVRQLVSTGVWVANSGSDADTAYVVTVDGCECRAGQEGDKVCKHRAALRAKLGLLAPEPGPPTPAAPAAKPARQARTVVIEIAGPAGHYRRIACATTAAPAPDPGPADDVCPECGGRGWVEDEDGEGITDVCPRCEGAAPAAAAPGEPTRDVPIVNIPDRPAAAA